MIERIRKYSAFLSLDKLSEKDFDDVKNLISNSGYKIEILGKSLEFSYEGRDAGNSVEEFFLELAKLIIDSDQEIICQEETDEEENWMKFYFYRIDGGKLFKQEGKIVRGRASEIEH